MQKSYWERRHLEETQDWIIVGAGFTGSFIALALRHRFPQAKIRLVDRASVGRGASTKNAGFICIGSLSELISHADSIGMDALGNLLRRRWTGRQVLLRFMQELDVTHTIRGGVELFDESRSSLWKEGMERLANFNYLLREVSGLSDFFDPHSVTPRGVRADIRHIHIQEEGMVDPLVLIQALHREVQRHQVEFIPNCNIVTMRRNSQEQWTLQTSDQGKLFSHQVILATNGLTQELLTDSHIEAIRNQVIVTTRVSHALEQSVHVDKGYFYLRPIGDRILIGGGRHLLGQEEQTSALTTTEKAKDILIQLGRRLLKVSDLEAEYQWSGTLGITSSCIPAIETRDDGLYIAAGMGGMGVSMAPQLAEELVSAL